MVPILAAPDSRSIWAQPGGSRHAKIQKVSLFEDASSEIAISSPFEDFLWRFGDASSGKLKVWELRLLKISAHLFADDLGWVRSV